MSNITACDGRSVWFTFNVTGLVKCENNFYHIIIVYYDNGNKHFEPAQNSYSLYNGSICNINLTINSVPLHYNKFLFHVEMLSTTSSAVNNSNYFRIIVQGHSVVDNIYTLKGFHYRST